MTQGRASLKDNSETSNIETKPDFPTSSQVVLSELARRSSGSVSRQPKETANVAAPSNLRKSATKPEAVIAYHNKQGGVFGARLAKVPEPIEPPKLKGRLSKILGSK